MIRPRRVLVSLEIETDAPLHILRKASEWDTGIISSDNPDWIHFRVFQAQANCVRTTTTKTPKPRKKA